MANENEKVLKARLRQKHDIEANWIKAGNAETPFIPLAGELIIYDKDDTHPESRFKIGDGVTNVNELSFEVEKDLFITEENIGAKVVPVNSSTWIRLNFPSDKTHVVEIEVIDEYGEQNRYHPYCNSGIWYCTEDWAPNCSTLYVQWLMDDETGNYPDYTTDIRYTKFALTSEVYTKAEVDKKYQELSAVDEVLRSEIEKADSPYGEALIETKILPVEGETDELLGAYVYTGLDYNKAYIVFGHGSEYEDGITLYLVGKKNTETCYVNIDIKFNTAFEPRKLVWRSKSSGQIVDGPIDITYAYEYSWNSDWICEVAKKYYSPEETYNKAEIDAQMELLNDFNSDISELYNQVGDINNTLDGKLDKFTTTTSGYYRAYIDYGNGTQGGMKIDSNGAEANSLVARTSDGTIRTAAPTNNADATTKKYVDDKVSSIPSASVKWDSDGIRGITSLTDLAMTNSLCGNKLNFMDTSDILLEYSHDAGATWNTQAWSSENKTHLVTETPTILDFKPNDPLSSDYNDALSLDHQLRITLTATHGELYFSCKKFLIYFSTNGAENCQVKVEKATIGSPNTFTTTGTYGIAGWSGWNAVPFQHYFGGSSNQSTQVRKVRFTFFAGDISKAARDFSVIKIYALGETMWNGNPVAKNNSLFTYDAAKNATFPATIKATDFVNAEGIGFLDLYKTKAEANGTKAENGKIIIDDIGKEQHTLDVKIVSKNLIPYPYDGAADYGKELKGLVITEDNGVIVINGTATADGAFNFISPYVANPKTIPVDGKYTIKGFPDGSNQLYLQPYFNGSSATVVKDKDVTYSVQGQLTRLTLFYKNGATFNNVRVAAQFEAGEVSTEYVPPLDVSSVILSRYGATEAENKETYTVNADGTVDSVLSLYPITTLETDNSNARIEVTYNSTKNNILVHETGNSYTKTMSQAAITNALAALREELLAAIQTGAQQAAEEIIANGEW